jgi:actin-like ATPase involved in cell morphogenesis
MGLVYGIDFGTTNSAVMVGTPSGRIIRIRNPVMASYEIPSAICLRRDSTMAVGTIATNMKRQRPAWFRDEFKRDIGRRAPYHFPPEEPGDLSRMREHPVHDLVAAVLQVLREQAKAEVAGTPELVVITVPASWEAGNRDQMLLAADRAGFERGRVQMITEPDAAVAYAVQEHLSLEERTFLIYDLGGGTFDCALVRGRNRLDFEVLGEPGSLNIGGATFDRLILGLIRRRYPAQTAKLMDGPAPDSQVLGRRLLLKETCEFAKRVLSSEDRYEADLNEFGLDVEFVLTREELTELLAPLLAETVAECERLLGRQRLSWRDIDGVLAVGGSSRLPMVGEAIANRSGSGRAPVLRVIDPELAVVHGAVLHARSRLDMPSNGSDPAALRTPKPSPAPPPKPGPSPGPTAHKTAPRSASRPGGPAPSAKIQDPAPATRSRAPDRRDPWPPESAAEYTGRRANAITSARHRAAISFWLAATTGVLAIVNTVGFVHGTTQTALTIAGYCLAGLTMISSLLTARSMHRALLEASLPATAAACILAAATVHYLVHGWIGWTIVTALLVVLAIFTVGTFGVLLPKS